MHCKKLEVQRFKLRVFELWELVQIELKLIENFVKFMKKYNIILLIQPLRKNPLYEGSNTISKTKRHVTFER